MQRRSWFLPGLKVAAAAALLLGPILETHRETSVFARFGDGSLIAIQAAHPGDAVHIESSLVEAGAFCVACELALQKGEEIQAGWQSAALDWVASSPTARPLHADDSALDSPQVRGPPTLTK